MSPMGHAPRSHRLCGHREPRGKPLNSTVARLIAASLLLATVPAISQTAPVEIDDFREFHEHVIEPYPVVTTPWVDLTRDYDTL